MKQYLTDTPFLERHRVDVLEAQAAFRKAREAVEAGLPSEAAKFRQIAERALDRLEQLYDDELKHKEPAR